MKGKMVEFLEFPKYQSDNFAAVIQAQADMFATVAFWRNGGYEVESIELPDRWRFIVRERSEENAEHGS